MEDEEKKESWLKSKKGKTLILFISLSVLGLYFLSWWLIDIFIKDWNTRGTFGDQFGAINALFSALAFLGLIVTLLMQMEELELQREELKLTRIEMKNQRAELEMQNSTLKRQKFESALYNMLQLQQQIVNDLAYDSTINGYSNVGARGDWNVQIHGRELFRFSFEQLLHYYKGADGELRTVEGMKGVLNKLGLSAYSDYNTPSYFDHYFRHLYRIIKFVDSNEDLSFEDKYRYIGDVRGVLSRYELVWIYYNVLANQNFYEFKRMIEDYALLKNLNESFLALSLENYRIFRRIGKETFKQNRLSCTDYEFFLTDRRDEPQKFYVGAFFNRQDISKGLNDLKRYHTIF